jgi:hypothetical protein
MRFDSAGVPSGPVFRVNTFTAGHQIQAALDLSASSDCVIARQSPDQDGSRFATIRLHGNDSDQRCGGRGLDAMRIRRRLLRIS